jgi:predicted amidophosphoribosyltransferase
MKMVRVFTAGAYAGELKSDVLRLKNANERSLAVKLGQKIVPLVANWSVDYITWAPTTDDRRRSRGFDHAELIARAVGKDLGIRTLPLLRREDAIAQHGRNRAERTLGPKMMARPRAFAKCVVVVDDVVTTGATLFACEAALLSAGASEVRLVAVAQTHSLIADDTKHEDLPNK